MHQLAQQASLAGALHSLSCQFTPLQAARLEARASEVRAARTQAELEVAALAAEMCERLRVAEAAKVRALHDIDRACSTILPFLALCTV